MCLQVWANILLSFFSWQSFHTYQNFEPAQQKRILLVVKTHFRHVDYLLKQLQVL